MPSYRIIALGMAWVLGSAASPPAQSSRSPKIDYLCGGEVEMACVSSALLEVRREASAGRSGLAAVRRHLGHALRGDSIQVIIGLSGITLEAERAARRAGLEIVESVSTGGVNALIARCTDVRQLDALAGLPGVVGIVPEPLAVTRAGSVANQADVSINADDARTTYGVSGAGVRVGVLSDSIFDLRQGGGSTPGSFPGAFTGTTDQISGDLPPSVWVIDPGPGFGPPSGDEDSDEGNGMAQLIYDLAPGCDISFASAFTSYLTFATNITALHTDATNPADVIVDDVGYFVEPLYQNGPIAIAANGAAAAGVPYFSSAGNDGDDAHDATYVDFSPGTDSTAFPAATGVDFHDFGVAEGMASDRFLTFTMSGAGSVIAVLHWDEPYGGTFAAGPGSAADLDLYLLDSTALPLGANVVDTSTNIQGTVGSPAGDAVEFLSAPLTAGTYHVAIDHFDGREPVRLHLGLFFSGAVTVVDSAYLGSSTIFGHPAAENAMAVAAMFYGEIDANGNLDPPLGQLDVESFSSLGAGMPFFFTDLGDVMPTQLRFKPEITAPDGTNTTFFGNDIGFDADAHPNFFGTSAAAPHAAAVAALMLERAADLGFTLTPAEVYATLRSTAIDAETPGPDFLSGDGLIDALTAVAAVQPTNTRGWPLYR